MRWIITDDHVATAGTGPSRVGYGHGEDGVLCQAEPKDVPAIAAALPTRFRIYDDDRRLVIEGKTKDIARSEGRAFAPLDFAVTDIGATSLEYLDNGEWRPL